MSIDLRESWRIGEVDVPTRLVLAPMAGVSVQAFRRQGFSSLIFKLADTDRFDAVKRELEADPRLTLEAKRETRFYADQSQTLSKLISYLGGTISAIFSRTPRSKANAICVGSFSAAAIPAAIFSTSRSSL